MRIHRAILTWGALAICGAMVVGAMVWLTRDVMASERERVCAEAKADLEERTRLALWRMDSLGASLMLRENSFSADVYQNGSSVFMEKIPDEVLLHFEIGSDGIPVSPEVTQAAELGVEPAGVVERSERLRRLTEFLDEHIPLAERRERLNVAAENETAWSSPPKDGAVMAAAKAMPARQIPAPAASKLSERNDSSYQLKNNIAERVRRAKAVAETFEQSIVPAEPAAPAMADAFSGEERKQVVAKRAASVGQMRPVWLEGELFLLRPVMWPAPSLNGDHEVLEQSVQGVWLNLPELKKRLLGETQDLLPGLELVSDESGQVVVDPLSLVSFPFRLDRPDLIGGIEVPISRALVIGWVAVGAAIFTTCLLVHGVMRLSERRASFVSAVTHELRTPLTTFRLYSDMLQTGVVKEEKKKDYLRVLSREADRLSHLVENVLSFSRIERGSARAVVKEHQIYDLLESMRERFESRLSAAGLALKMDLESGDALKAKVDSASVEHVLFNLIDNAAKYATGSNPAEVEIETHQKGGQIEISVRDHGPGIPLAERRKIFRAFHKSAHDAAESRPGVGLGLALSRRLAGELGGTLEYRDVGGRGACFVLSFPKI